MIELYKEIAYVGCWWYTKPSGLFWGVKKELFRLRTALPGANSYSYKPDDAESLAHSTEQDTGETVFSGRISYDVAAEQFIIQCPEKLKYDSDLRKRVLTNFDLLFMPQDTVQWLYN